MINPEEYNFANVHQDHIDVFQSDLRIGNIVDAVCFDGYVNRQIVTSINDEGIELSPDFNLIMNCEYEFRQLRPIPLTSDILLSLGAVPIDGGFPFMSKFNLNGMQIMHTPQEGWKEYVYQTPIRGVHHLQNLMYFTRCIEIDVTPLMN